MANWKVLIILLCTAVVNASATLQAELIESLSTLSLEELALIQTKIRTLIEEQKNAKDSQVVIKKHRIGRKLLGAPGLVNDLTSFDFEEYLNNIETKIYFFRLPCPQVTLIKTYANTFQFLPPRSKFYAPHYVPNDGR